jgi:hypothetical protein
LLPGCKKSIHNNYEITKVEFARSSDWSDLGTSISIDSSLNYKYWGDYGKTKQGYFIGAINPKYLDTLNQMLQILKFKTVDTDTNMHVSDAEYYELIIHWGTNKRRIMRIGDGNPDTVLNLCRWLDISYKNAKLRPVNDSIKFETTSHIRLADHIKFPLPIIKKY